MSESRTVRRSGRIQRRVRVSSVAKGMSAANSAEPVSRLVPRIRRVFDLDADGCLSIPQSPGLGFNVNADGLKRFCPNRIEFR